ncbi:MAG: T9SS type A sorting domain-containing protein [Bacteroidota bacterium]|nr:T9SS type A sorting domain-containing protein [Bacteroidota bacterium]
MKKNIFLLGLFLITNLVFAQNPTNLVVNPSFENLKMCPPNIVTQPSQFEQYIEGWLNPTTGTPDVINECNNSQPPSVGVPNNMFGSMPARSGVGYVGIHTFVHTELNHKPIFREYIQIPVYLKKDIIYNIQFHISLSSNSGYATRIGYHLSTTRPNSQNDKPLNITVPLDQVTNSINQLKGQWEIINFTKTVNTTGTYYLTIGDFFQNDDLAAQIDASLLNFAYYYIDDVSVTADGCCLPILNISNTDIRSLSVPYVASANHTVNVGPGVTVQSGANAIFTAGSNIEFSSDFEGTDFEAYLSPCPEETQIKKAAGLGPTIITPYNTGGDNNQLCLNYVSGATSYIVKIYTTTGALVYSNTQFIIGLPVCVWNGKSAGGNPVAEAIYEVEITLNGCDDKSLLVTGRVRVSNSQFMIVNNSEFEELVQLSFAEETFDDVIKAFNKKESMVKSNVENTEKNIESSHSNYKLFPNPSSGIFDIQLPLGSTEPTIIRIFNGEGKIIFQEKTFNDLLKVNISCFARGIYYLKAMKGEDILIIEKVIIN